MKNKQALKKYIAAGALITLGIGSLIMNQNCGKFQSQSTGEYAVEENIDMSLGPDGRSVSFATVMTGSSPCPEGMDVVQVIPSTAPAALCQIGSTTVPAGAPGYAEGDVLKTSQIYVEGIPLQQQHFQHIWRNGVLVGTEHWQDGVQIGTVIFNVGSTTMAASQYSFNRNSAGQIISYEATDGNGNFLHECEFPLTTPASCRTDVNGPFSFVAVPEPLKNPDAKEWPRTYSGVVATATAPNKIDYTFTNLAPGFRYPVPLDSAPQRPVPANDTTGVSVDSPLTWSSIKNAATYDIYFGTSSNPPYVASVKSASYRPSGLKSGQKYFWKVIAKSINGARESEEWSFITAPATVAAASLVSPLPNSRLSDTTETFRWKAAVDADGYWFDVGTSAGSGDICASGVLNSSVLSFPCTKMITSGGAPIHVQLYTRVRGKWQTPVRSTLLPASAAISAPLAGKSIAVQIASGPLTLTWKKIAGAEAYHIDVGTAPGQGNVCAGAVGPDITSYSCPNVPRLTKIHVQIFTKFKGVWSPAQQLTYQ